MSDKPAKRHNIHYQLQAVLARRDHSVAETRQKLQRKGFARDDIEEAIAKAQGNKLLDDERFTRIYIESIVRSKPVGPRYLTAKLRQKGISPSLLQKVLADLVPADRVTELKQAATLNWKKSHPQHAEDKLRLMRFLASRGF